MEKLKEIRKSKKISQKEFAEHMNVAQNTVSRWETGERLMDSDTLIKAADFFNVSVDYLLGRAKRSQTITVAQKSAESMRLIDEYTKLNDLGKHEAVKRIKELSLIPSYRGKEIPIAAHSEGEINEEEMKLLREDVEEL